MVAKFAKKESLGSFMNRMVNRRTITWNVNFIMNGQTFKESMESFLKKCFDYGSEGVIITSYEKRIDSGVSDRRTSRIIRTMGVEQ